MTIHRNSKPESSPVRSSVSNFTVCDIATKVFFSEWITLNVIFHRSINWNKNALALSVFRYLQDFEVVEALEHGARDVSQVVARESPVEGQKKWFGSFAVQHIDYFNREKRIWWIHKDKYACVCAQELMVKKQKWEISLEARTTAAGVQISLAAGLYHSWTEISLLYGLQTRQHILKAEPRYECALSSFCLLWQQTFHSTSEFIHNGQR